MAGRFLNALSGFSSDVLDGIRAKSNERLDDAAFEERVVGIKNATAALLEADVAESQIIQLLQKYWDLRLSEAKEFIEMQKDIKE